MNWIDKASKLQYEAFMRMRELAILGININEKMRRPERIPIVMRNIDIEQFLAHHLTDEQYKNSLGKHDLLFALIKDWGTIEEGWKKQYDTRLGQYLINQGYIPDNMKIWNVEEVDYMVDYNMIEPRDIIFWGVNYTKDKVKLPETEWRLIKDLETSHIEAIINEGYVDNNETYKGFFENELERRAEEQIHDDD